MFDDNGGVKMKVGHEKFRHNKFFLKEIIKDEFLLILN